MLFFGGGGEHFFFSQLLFFSTFNVSNQVNLTSIKRGITKIKRNSSLNVRTVAAFSSIALSCTSMSSIFRLYSFWYLNEKWQLLPAGYFHMLISIIPSSILQYHFCKHINYKICLFQSCLPSFTFSSDILMILCMCKYILDINITNII